MSVDSPNEKYLKAQCDFPDQLRAMAIEKSKLALKEQKILIQEYENSILEFKKAGTKDLHEKALLACLKVKSGQTHTANIIISPHSFRTTIPLTSMTNLKNDVINELNNEKGVLSNYSSDNMIKIYKGLGNEEAAEQLLLLRELSYKSKEHDVHLEQASFLVENYKG